MKNEMKLNYMPHSKSGSITSVANQYKEEEVEMPPVEKRGSDRKPMYTFVGIKELIIEGITPLANGTKFGWIMSKKEVTDGAATIETIDDDNVVDKYETTHVVDASSHDQPTIKKFKFEPAIPFVGRKLHLAIQWGAAAEKVCYRIKYSNGLLSQEEFANLTNQIIITGL